MVLIVKPEASFYAFPFPSKEEKNTYICVEFTFPPAEYAVQTEALPFLMCNKISRKRKKVIDIYWKEEINFDLNCLIMLYQFIDVHNNFPAGYLVYWL